MDSDGLYSPTYGLQALAENLVFVTHNIKHFEKVVGLQVEDWMG